VVTGITETTVTLVWNPATDNSGKFSYKVRINNLNNSAYNSLASVSQSETTYTAKFLATNSPYTFSVYAVDGAGNRSGDSNIVNASTLADKTPPQAPVLEATVLGPSQVQLSWTKSMDNVANHCCSYGININGNRVTEHINWVAGPPENLTVVIRHLTPATSYSFSISVWDWSGGNVATSNTVDATSEPSSDIVPPTAPSNLHLVRDDGCAEVWLGWTEATDETDAQTDIEYEIYVNDVLSPLAVSAGVNLDFVYGTAAGDNLFYVKAVDRSGNTSAASNPIRLFLWPC
jgi:chitin-binding protein